MIKRLAFLLLIPVAAFAGLRVIEKHDGWQLTAGTKVTAHANYADCLAAAKALGPGASKCKDVTAITVEATCDDEPKPEMKAVLDADGFLVLPELKVEALPDGSWGPTMEQGFVKGPGYPNCWVPGLVPYTGEWHAPDGPPSLDEGPWVYGVDYPVGTACPKEAHAGCYIPPNPTVPPPAP